MSEDIINYSIGGRKLIYICSFPNLETHKGCVKIGDASYYGNLSERELRDNHPHLQAAARERINEWTGTAGLSKEYSLDFVTLASTNSRNCFRDYAVQKVLKNSNIQKKKFGSANEWYVCSVETAKKAICAVKEGRSALSANEIIQDVPRIEFRPEQKDAIEKTLKCFNKKNEFLWDCKMRFGKTLCALEVAKRLHVQRTIIYTHRPVVNDGWREDFKKIFNDETLYLNHESFENFVSEDKTPYIYFASLQDLRGSEQVGGNFDKNQKVFKTNWDLVIIDEAHEGTQTELAQVVFNAVVKKDSKVLHLSGTTFNIQSRFSADQTFSWTYLDEQRAKEAWFRERPDEPNPYEMLPRMNILTIDISSELIAVSRGPLDEAVHFSFAEFFKTYTGDPEKDGDRTIPEGTKIGDFIDPVAVKQFLRIITTPNEKTNFPFASEENINLFKHTLWVVPGVKEAHALEKLMSKTAPFIESNNFKIVNVAGGGNASEDEDPNALVRVREAVKNYARTVTITCGRLTTGTTVPEWTAVLMLNGSNNVPSYAGTYLQTIFRVQTPWEVGSWYKTNCYVFDFSPNRTLNCIAYAARAACKHDPQKDFNEQQIEAVKNFVNYCPIIALGGNCMQFYSAEKLMRELRKVKIERAVFSGFDDESIYNLNELVNAIKCDPAAIKTFENLKGIIGKTKQTVSTGQIDLNLTPEVEDPPAKRNKKGNKTSKPVDPAVKKAKDLISILRGISIRIPILIFGADVAIEKAITLENFTEIIDDKSWTEFMPRDVSKKMFNEIKKYYDAQVFIGAGIKIREFVKAADNYTVADRVSRIAEIFSYWKNPDKETVLTPWRVVNMQLSDTLGGYDFFEKESEHRVPAENPRYVDRGKVSQQCFNKFAKILEINSKTGLYPLYMAYSIYRSRADENKKTSRERWNETLEKNIFVVCKTPMAAAITRRTLAGFTGTKTNIICIPEIEKCGENLEKIKKIILAKFNMKFNAIVGNPPYQIMDGGAGASAKPVYHNFVELAKNLNPDYISLIMPARWMTGGKGLDDFRDSMIHDKKIIVLHDFTNSKDCFPNVDIKGGVCYFLRSRENEKPCEITSHTASGISRSRRFLANENDEIFIRDERMIAIKEKAAKFNERSMVEIVSSRNPYGLPTDLFKGAQKYNLPNLCENPIEGGFEIIGLGEKQKRTSRYVPADYPFPKRSLIESYKIFIPYAYGCGIIGESPATPVLATPRQVCLETFIEIGPFPQEQEMENAYNYLRTKFFRFLVGICKQTQHATQKVYQFVPIQDFTEKSDIDWAKSVPEIDLQLYKKYGLEQSEIDFIESVIKPM